jgi:hypothetical protein
MKMTGQDEIDTAPSKSSDGNSCPSNQAPPFDVFGQIERMVCHHYPGHAWLAWLEKLQASRHLTLIYSAILEGVGARRVDSHNRDLSVDVGRVKVRVNIAAVSI